MLSPIKSALIRIYNTIPPEILKAAFEKEVFGYDISMDEAIKQCVLVPRVLEDVSQRIGRIKKIVLQLKWAHYTNPVNNASLAVSGSFSTFHVPAEEREYRDIITVLDVQFPYNLSQGGSASFLSDCSIAGNTVGQLACRALGSQTKANWLSTPTCIALPGNILKFTPEVMNYVPWVVRVRLKYDNEFSQMDINSINSFCSVCEHAVKAYCYIHLLGKVESNLVFKGMDLGFIKDVIGSYSDANEKYEEQLLALGGADTFDPERLRNILAKIMPSA